MENFKKHLLIEYQVFMRYQGQTTGDIAGAEWVSAQVNDGYSTRPSPPFFFHPRASAFATVMAFNLLPIEGIPVGVPGASSGGTPLYSPPVGGLGGLPK